VNFYVFAHNDNRNDSLGLGATRRDPGHRGHLNPGFGNDLGDRNPQRQMHRDGKRVFDDQQIKIEGLNKLPQADLLFTLPLPKLYISIYIIAMPLYSARGCRKTFSQVVLSRLILNTTIRKSIEKTG